MSALPDFGCAAPLPAPQVEDAVAAGCLEGSMYGLERGNAEACAHLPGAAAKAAARKTGAQPQAAPEQRVAESK